jgi:hypothetical protein
MKQNVAKLNQQAIDNLDDLMESVTSYVLRHWDEYDDLKQIPLEVLEHGCVSGIVSGLVWYSDTTAYYAKNKDEINKLLYEKMDEWGVYSLNEIFSRDPSWDEEDPLALYDYNQNLLAWFGFEETMRNFAREFEEFEELI